MKASLSTVALLFCIAFLPAGCVAQRQYDELELAYRRSQEQVGELENRIAELRQQIAMLEAHPEQYQERIDDLTQERDQLIAQLEDLRGQIEGLAEREPVMLPTEVDEALREFADQHPDMVEYDASRGMLRFRSDVTFDLGSADLTSEAQRTLARFGDLLNDPSVRGYEVRIVGHTDTVPISREETRQRHPTNWHLSVHRSISVRDAIEDANVDPIRTSVAGYGPYRPVVQNTASGAERNRRVEIYLVSMTDVNRDYLRPTGESRQRSEPSAPAPAPRPDAAEPDSDEIPLK